MVQVIIDEDIYEGKGPQPKGQLAKYSQLHEEVKNKLTMSQDRACELGKSSNTSSTESERESSCSSQ